jgi:glucose-1-phosphate adenylyltransferase
MQGAVIGENVVLDKAIIADDCKIGNGVKIGVGEYAESKFNPKVYNSDLAVVGEGSVIPNGVSIGKNTAIAGETVKEDYKDGLLESGDSIIKAGVKA